MNNENSVENILASVNNTDDIAIAIEKLERKKNVLEQELRDDFHKVATSLRPGNILKSTIAEVRESTPLRHNLLQVALGLGAGYFSRKLVVGKSAGLLKKALGTALQFGVTKLVAGKNTEEEGNGLPHTKKKGLLRRIFSSV